MLSVPQAILLNEHLIALPQKKTQPLFQTTFLHETASYQRFSRDFNRVYLFFSAGTNGFA